MSQPHEERYQPLPLIGVTLVALLGFAVFFLSFLVAPLAILIIFYVGFTLSDRSKRNAAKRDAQAPSGDAADEQTAPEQGSAALLARARHQRRQTIERSDQPRADDQG